MMKLTLALAVSFVCATGFAMECEEVVAETEVSTTEIKGTECSGEETVPQNDSEAASNCGCNKGKGKGDNK